MVKRLRKKIPSGFDSWFEYDLANSMPSCSYHTNKIDYVQYKKYSPDFSYVNEGKITYIEAKGRFRNAPEARKYIDVRKSLKENETLVFIFYNPKTPMPYAKIRSNGTKMTHGEWATKHGFQYYTIKRLPLEWSRTLST